MKTRKAKLTDAKSLSRLAMSLGKFYSDDYSSDISPFFAKKITVESFKSYLMDENAYEHYVYEENEMIIGYFSLLNATHFLYLFVNEKHHKKGVARALVEYALKGKEHKSYSVNSSIYAVPFYEKLGFKSYALVQKHHGMVYKPMVWIKE